MTRDPLGKRALFSEPQKKGPLDVVVHCSSCGASTPLSVPRFVAQHVPFWLWLPWREHSHLMRCPSCGALSWHKVS